MRSTLRLEFLHFWLFVSFAAVGVCGCVTESGTESNPPRLRAGMSRDDLRACFGKPMRIESAPSGGEDWYYPFSSGNVPQVDTNTSDDSSGARTDSVSVTVSDTKATQEFPVHLSSDGYVIEPLPEGPIVRK